MAKKTDNDDGRQKVGWWPTDETLAQITEWVAGGETIHSIINRFNITKAGFYKKMRSNNPRICDENGNNKLKDAIDLGRAAGVDPILAIIYTKATTFDHKDQVRCGTWWAEKVAKIGSEPQVIVVNEKGETVDKTPEEMAELLRKHRPRLQAVE